MLNMDLFLVQKKLTTGMRDTTIILLRIMFRRKRKHIIERKMQMKQKIVTALLTAAMTATIFSGCGESEQAASGSVETTVETGAAGETSAETEETAQAAEEPAESTEETAAEAAEPAGGVAESAETAAAGGTAASQAAENTAAEGTEVESTGVSGSTGAVETAEPEVSYSYTDMDAVMWATAAVNVRDLPSTDGARVGGLSGGQEVRVTGVCNETGWYRLEGDSRFVSGSYLSDSAPVAVAASSPGTSPRGTVGAAEGAVAASTSSAYSEAQLVGEFLTILNNRRAAEGLSQVSGGSDALNADALASVTAVHANFTHDSVVRNSGLNRENIANGQQTAQEVFDSWYASDGHRVAMMDPNLQSVACARYLNTWVMVGIASNPAVEMPVEQAVEEGYLEKVNEVDVGNGQTITTYATPGSEYIPTEEERQMAEEAFANWEW